MPQLWIPDSAPQPDPTNIYDLALAMQETLVTLPGERKIEHARYALEALTAYFDRLAEPQRSISLHADTAILSTTGNKLQLVYDIGICGLLEDIQYVQLANMPFGLSLAIEAHMTFNPQQPESHEFTNLALKAPITAVRYIESAA